MLPHRTTSETPPAGTVGNIESKCIPTLRMQSRTWCANPCIVATLPTGRSESRSNLPRTAGRRELTRFAGSMGFRPSGRILCYEAGESNPVNPGIDGGEIPEPKEENARIAVRGDRSGTARGEEALRKSLREQREVQYTPASVEAVRPTKTTFRSRSRGPARSS